MACKPCIERTKATSGSSSGSGEETVSFSGFDSDIAHLMQTAITRDAVRPPPTTSQQAHDHQNEDCFNCGS